MWPRQRGWRGASFCAHPENLCLRGAAVQSKIQPGFEEDFCGSKLDH